jgi:lambda family phage minor tail protein L
MGINSDVQKLIIEGKINLFQLDLSNYGGEVLHFHGHASFNDQVSGSLQSEIIWQGQVYHAIPISVKGLEQRTDGKASSPTLTIGNIFEGVQGGLSALCLQFKDFANCKLRVIETFVKYLDAANFAEGNPSASNDSLEQIWYIEQKTAETATEISFDLSNPIDYGGQVLPGRQITSLCDWAIKGRYRGEECGYMGTKYFTDKDEPTNDPSKDYCRGLLKSCTLRFGNDPLPFGGFPSAGMI